jgi:hypothetical protein
MPRFFPKSRRISKATFRQELKIKIFGRFFGQRDALCNPPLLKHFPARPSAKIALRPRGKHLPFIRALRCFDTTQMRAGWEGRSPRKRPHPQTTHPLAHRCTLTPFKDAKHAKCDLEAPLLPDRSREHMYSKVVERFGFPACRGRDRPHHTYSENRNSAFRKFRILGAGGALSPCGLERQTGGSQVPSPMEPGSQTRLPHPPPPPFKTLQGLDRVAPQEPRSEVSKALASRAANPQEPRLSRGPLPGRPRASFARPLIEMSFERPTPYLQMQRQSVETVGVPG